MPRSSPFPKNYSLRILMLGKRGMSYLDKAQRRTEKFLSLSLLPEKKKQNKGNLETLLKKVLNRSLFFGNTNQNVANRKLCKQVSARTFCVRAKWMTPEHDIYDNKKNASIFKFKMSLANEVN